MAPVPSSQQFQSRIRLACTSLRQRLDAFPAAFSAVTDHAKSHKENLTELRDRAADLETMLSILDVQVAVIYETKKRWFAMIDRMDEAGSEEAERKVNDRFNDEAKYVELLQEGQTRADDYKLQRRDLEKAIIALESTLGGTEGVLVRLELPKVELPIFDGDVLRYHDWWSFFESTVHSNSQISGRLKLSFLKSSLKGHAKRLVDGYKDVDENYAVVVKLLRDQFGRDDIVAQALNRELRELRRPTEKTASLRHYVEDMQRICRQLETCHESTESATVRDLIESKLPDSALTEIVKAKKASTTADPWTTKALRAKLQDVVDLREEVERTNERLNERMKHDRAREDEAPPASAVFANCESEKPMCLFCDRDGHLSADCEEIAGYNERFKKAMELSLCLKCLKKGHRKNECRSNAFCYVCQSKDHNAALCRMSKAQRKSEDNVTASVKVAPKEEWNRVDTKWFSVG